MGRLRKAVCAAVAGAVLAAVLPEGVAAHTLAPESASSSLWPSLHFLTAGSAGQGSPGWTPSHKTGRCAMRGQCGSASIFSPEQPCVDNGPAGSLSAAALNQLELVCGPRWRDLADRTGVCCDDVQVDVLASNLHRIDQIVGSCPACRHNLFELFCTLTCSPDQASFSNVTAARTISQGRPPAVDAISVGIDGAFGDAVFDSCKDVQFGSGLPAMSLIGGGATNRTEMLAFLGKKRMGGSPFEIGFVDHKSGWPLRLADGETVGCDSSGELGCACADCAAVCPLLEPVDQPGCYAGVLPCLTVSVIVLYGLGLLIWVATLAGPTKRITRSAPLLHTGSDQLALDQEQADYSPGRSSDWSVQAKLQGLFYRLGKACARRAWKMVVVGVAIGLVCAIGLVRLRVETDPVKLWVAPDSTAAIERAAFQSRLGPQIRPQQLIAVNRTGPVLSRSALEWWIGIEDRVAALDIGGVGWNDICLRPAGECVVQSVGGYFQDQSLAGWQDRLRVCVARPVDCLVDGMPIDGNLVLGRPVQPDDDARDFDPVDAPATILTWVVDGSLNSTAIAQWEAMLDVELAAIAADGRARGLEMSFSTGRSLEAELQRTAQVDGRIVAVSYAAMLLYVIFSLSVSVGWSSEWIGLAVSNKLIVGIAGIGLVGLSVAAAAGLVAAAGLSATLVIVDVIPFLVLAVGVDNVFLIVHAVDRGGQISVTADPFSRAAIEDRIAVSMSRVGPSIAVAAAAESALFALGAAVGMPAVRNFAVYAAMAVLVNAALQLTVFPAIVALDLSRAGAGYINLISSNGRWQHRTVYQRSSETVGLFRQFVCDTAMPTLFRYRRLVVPITVASAAFFTAVLLPNVQLGLDQRLALPADSHLIPYFDHLADYLQVGPPVFFVVDHVDPASPAGQPLLCGRTSGCDPNSVPTLLTLEGHRPDVSAITGSVASWEDDFFRWLDPATGCCANEDGSACWEGYNRQVRSMPHHDHFIRLLDRWLTETPDQDCPLGGSPYRSALFFRNTSLPDGSTDRLVAASHFRTSHTPVRTQADFIAAYASARRIAAEVADATGTRVFPFSDFYVFFHQYLTIIPLATRLLATAAVVQFVVLVFFLGSAATAGVVTAVVVSTVIHVVGAMAVFGIDLNAVTVVNLVICAGLAVEFCVHLARAYAFPYYDTVELLAGQDQTPTFFAKLSLIGYGPSIVEGIGLTKLIGVFVLAFAQSKIFDLYYFRLWMILIFFALTHALIVLPVALASYGGPSTILTDPNGTRAFFNDIFDRQDSDLNLNDEQNLNLRTHLEYS